MNQLDVRAIGWVITRDACADIVRALLGGQRQAPASTLQSLGERWLAVRVCMGKDARGAMGYALQPLGTALSHESAKAVERFVLHMVSSCPERYSEPVLRGRCGIAAAQAFMGFVGGTIAGSIANADHVFFGDAAIVLLFMGCISLISLIQLLRTYRIVRRVSQTPVSTESQTESRTLPSSNPQPPATPRNGAHEHSKTR